MDPLIESHTAKAEAPRTRSSLTARQLGMPRLALAANVESSSDWRDDSIGRVLDAQPEDLKFGSPAPMWNQNVVEHIRDCSTG